MIEEPLVSFDGDSSGGRLLDRADPHFSGRKTFFVQPSSVVQKEMMGELIRYEFEVFLVPRVADAKPIFYENPHCLAFINIDDGIAEDEWVQFVREIHADPALKNVRLGILTYNEDPRLAETYLMELGVPCGFVRLSLNLDESTEIMRKVLDANEARGRRKYLRVHCDGTTRMNFRTPETKVEGKVLDLSSVGMSCVLNPDKNWSKHTVFRSIQLNLRGSLVLVDGVVVGSRANDSGGGIVYVILFDPKSVGHQMDKIQAYIHTTLQESVDRFLRSLRRKGVVEAG